MGFLSFLRDLLFGTKEEQEAVRKQRQEERRRDWERTNTATREDLTTYQRINRVEIQRELDASRERTRELLEEELRRRREREQEHERRYRELGLRKSHRLPPKFRPK